MVDGARSGNYRLQKYMTIYSNKFVLCSILYNVSHTITQFAGVCHSISSISLYLFYQFIINKIFQGGDCALSGGVAGPRQGCHQHHQPEARQVRGEDRA